MNHLLIMIGDDVQGFSVFVSTRPFRFQNEDRRKTTDRKKKKFFTKINDYLRPHKVLILKAFVTVELIRN